MISTNLRNPPPMLRGQLYLCMAYSGPKRITGASVSEHPATRLFRTSVSDSWKQSSGQGFRKTNLCSGTLNCRLLSDQLLMELQDLRNHGDSAHNPHHDY